MGSKRKKTALSVQFEPLGEKVSFDIRPPKAGPLPSPQAPKGGRGPWKELGYFCGMSLALGIVFSVLAIGTSGWGLFQEAKPLALAGYESLQAGMGALKGQDFEGAEAWFSKAETVFDTLSSRLQVLTGQASRWAQTPLYLDAAGKLIESGVTGSQMGGELATLVEEAKNIPSAFRGFSLPKEGQNRPTDALRPLAKKIENLNEKAVLLQNNLTTLNAEALPAELQAQVEKAQGAIALFLETLLDLRRSFGAALKLLGDPSPHRYLVLLQNNRELRATGGFIGSYLLVTLDRGAITQLETKDVYDTDGNLADLVPAPPGIDRVADRWYMRDANYSPDFPTAARQILWFLEHSRGPSADTVIAVDPAVAEALLKLTGPIPLNGFPIPLDSENFADLLSFHVESKQSGTDTPKQLLVDLVPVFKEKLTALQDFAALAETLATLVAERHIQAYSVDSDIESFAQRLHADGAMIAPDGKTDFLALVTTSIGGNKSDAYLQTQVDHQTSLDAVGRLTDRLSITKTHTWKEADFSLWQRLIDHFGTGRADLKTLRFIQGEGDNLDYLRIYVPQGSRLLASEGVDTKKVTVSQDLGYTVFAFPFGPVSAGQQKTISLAYELPFSLAAEAGDFYRFIGQKQAGSENSTLKKSLMVPETLNIVETYPKTDASPFALYPSIEVPFDTNKIFLSALAPAF